MIKSGRCHGADWFLCVDADERMEERLVQDIRSLVIEAESRNVQAFSFHLRDLWNDRFNYRVDGSWGKRAGYKLFRNFNTHTRFDPRRLHRYWMPLEILADIGKVGAVVSYAIYHLRMIRLEDRIARYQRYIQIDPNSLLQRQGYGHLVDEKNLQLALVTPDRDFLPKYDPALK